MLVRYRPPCIRKLLTKGELIARLCLSGKAQYYAEIPSFFAWSRLWIRIVNKIRSVDPKATIARKLFWYIDAFCGIKRIFNA